MPSSRLAVGNAGDPAGWHSSRPAASRPGRFPAFSSGRFLVRTSRWPAASRSGLQDLQPPGHPGGGKARPLRSWPLGRPPSGHRDGGPLKSPDVSADHVAGGGPMRRIVLASQKGGVGKSVTAWPSGGRDVPAGHADVARRLRRAGQHDLDDEGGQGAEPPTLAAVLLRQARPTRRSARRTCPGLDLLPADASLGGVNVALVQEVGRDTRLRSAPRPRSTARYDVGDPRHGADVHDDPGQRRWCTRPRSSSRWTPGVYAVLGLVQLQDDHRRGARSLRQRRAPPGRPGADEGVAEQRRPGRRGRAAGPVRRPGLRGDDPALGEGRGGARTRGRTVMEYAPKSPAAVAYEQLVEEVIGHGASGRRGRGCTWPACWSGRRRLGRPRTAEEMTPAGEAGRRRAVGKGRGAPPARSPRPRSRRRPSGSRAGRSTCPTTCSSGSWSRPTAGT